MQIIQRVRRWDQNEDEYIRTNYLNMTDEEIGEVLGRTQNAVKSERQKLKLYRPYAPRSTKQNHPKPTFQEIQRMFETKDYELLSDESEYINQGSKMRYICNKHRDKGEQSITVYHLKEGKGCYYCGRERTEASRKSKVTPEEDQKLCELKGFKYVKTETINGVPYIYFICKEHQLLGVQKMSRGNMNREEVHGCQYCCGKNLPHWYIKYVIETTFSNIKVLSEYKGMNKSLDCYCTIHNEYFTQLAKDVFYYGRGCKSCWHENMSKRQMLSVDEVKRRLLNKNPNIEILNLNEYNGWDTRMRFKCKNCGETWEQPFYSATINNCRCPRCQRQISAGEEAVAKQLLRLNVSFISQYKFDGCKYKNALPFDFAIINSKNKVIGLIEYQGEQHYKPIDYFGGEVKFKQQIKRDEIKREYCEKNNIPLLIIPYWNYNHIEILLNEFIDKL